MKVKANRGVASVVIKEASVSYVASPEYKT